MHVTIAGVVGTWWFAPQDASSMFSPAIQDSFRRSTTYSFGSMCMGSLLVAIIQLLQQLAHQLRRNDHLRGCGGTGGTILLCIVECLLYYIQNIAAYFNHWAFIYVGLYGYDYLTAGQKTMSLFQGRGWSNIITDNLVSRVLLLVCMVIGALTGLVGLLLNRATGWANSSLGEHAHNAVFTLCFVLGFSLAMILMSVVHSAVDTVIVCFAEAPMEFQTNHPALCQQMMTAWQQVYPDECGF